MFTSTTVLMVIFIFTFVPLILAELARNKSLPTLEDFFLQSRKMPTFMVFFTVYATWMSAFAFLGASVYFYEKGPIYMTALAWDILFGILFMVVGKRIWFYGRTNGYITPSDFFNDIFGSRLLNVVVTFTMILFTLPYLQIQLSGGAYLIEVASGGLIPWRICGLVFYLIIIIYLWAGGMRAVAFTDVFYGLCLLLSMLFIGFFLVNKAGGFQYVFNTLVQMDERNVALPGPGGDAGELLWMCLFITVPIGALMGPQMWLRVYAPEKEKTFDIIPLLICLAAFQCIGTMLAGSASILLAPNPQHLDTIIPVMLLKHGDEIMCALLFCGIASAALSTANSQIHAVSAIYTVDIHKRYLNPKASEKKLVLIGKWAVLILSAVAYMLMLMNPGLIIDTGTVAMGGTAQIIIPTLGALFWKRSKGFAGAIGVMVGITILLVVSFAMDLNASYGGVLALICNGLVFLVGSLLIKDDAASGEKILRYRNAYEKRGQAYKAADKLK